jgi:exodeoxyribonuclease V alpha subunit
MEEETAERIYDIADYKFDCDERKLRLLIAQYERENNIILDEGQIEAVIEAYKNPICVIYGGPGTGKTTIEKVILYINSKIDKMQTMLMAPSARAAKRMEESTGEEASTVHKALRLRLDVEVEEVEFENVLIILDEGSMVESSLAHKLFTAIKKGCRVVILGDPDQLPSVGPGAVLRDMIESGVVKTVML